jgi:hypothetical protein
VLLPTISFDVLAQLNVLHLARCAVLMHAGDLVDVPDWPSGFERRVLMMIHKQKLWCDPLPLKPEHAAAAGFAAPQAFGQLLAAACRIVELQRLSDDIGQSE